jgi:hypothetical protein
MRLPWTGELWAVVCDSCDSYQFVFGPRETVYKSANQRIAPMTATKILDQIIQVLNEHVEVYAEHWQQTISLISSACSETLIKKTILM